MSIIVAVKHGGAVFMGADTQTSYKDFKTNSLAENNFKITRLPCGLLIGSSGRADIAARVVHAENVFTVPPEGLSKKYIVTVIIPELFHFLDERELLGTDDDDDEDEESGSMDCSLILAHKDKLFYINGNFSVWECDKFCVGGSGDGFAFPYMKSFDDGKDVHGQLLTAMRAAARHDQAVSAPFILIDSKNLDYKVELC